MTVVCVRTVPDAVPAIALIPGVKWIAEKTFREPPGIVHEPGDDPDGVAEQRRLHDEQGRSAGSSGTPGIDGTATSQIVTMMDSGLNTKMEHFSQDTVSNGTVGAAHRKVVGYDVYGGDQCVLDT